MKIAYRAENTFNGISRILFTDDGNISISKYVNENNIANSTMNDLKKYREKNDLIYKESIEVPFENVQDSSGMWEVNIKLNRGTRLVGTISNNDDIVKEFDFLFDYDADIPEDGDQKSSSLKNLVVRDQRR